MKVNKNQVIAIIKDIMAQNGHYDDIEKVDILSHEEAICQEIDVDEPVSMWLPADELPLWYILLYGEYDDPDRFCIISTYMSLDDAKEVISKWMPTVGL